MPEPISVLRRAQRHNAQLHSGVDPMFGRALVSEVELSLIEQQIRSLPVWAYTVLPQVQDPTTGQLYFVIDGSIIDGPDQIR